MGNKTTYDRSFKEEAVKIAMETSVSKAVQNLGVPENTVCNRVKRSIERPDNPFIGSGHTCFRSQ